MQTINFAVILQWQKCMLQTKWACYDFLFRSTKERGGDQYSWTNLIFKTTWPCNRLNPSALRWQANEHIKLLPITLKCCEDSKWKGFRTSKAADGKSAKLNGKIQHRNMTHFQKWTVVIPCRDKHVKEMLQNFFSSKMEQSAPKWHIFHENYQHLSS